jgi:hypothetical protein
MATPEAGRDENAEDNVADQHHLLYGAVELKRMASPDNSDKK